LITRDGPLALARPGTLKFQGIPLPFHINRKTGLIAVEASIDGRSYPITIDNGSAYTWVRQSTVKNWLALHPDWERGVGAVGASNVRMSGDGTETFVTLLRIPEIAMGSLRLKDVGVLAAGPGRLFGNLDLFDWYSEKNAVPVIGWVGGNVLKGFRLTIDYPIQTMYWLRQTGPDSHDLDQVGLTLRFDRGEYTVAAVVKKHGAPTVDGVLPGDRLVRVGGRETRNATWGALYNAMHGKAGETRMLVLERDGNRLTVVAKSLLFDLGGNSRLTSGSAAYLDGRDHPSVLSFPERVRRERRQPGYTNIWPAVVLDAARVSGNCCSKKRSWSRSCHRWRFLCGCLQGHCRECRHG
jgi:hypothetical protein